MALTTGELIEGKYRIVRLLGEGGMGAVYEGENTRIRRRVAIKVLHQGVAENQEVVQRFEREAQAAGRIGNEHILEVLDMGTLPNGDHFMVMEFLDGEALSDRIGRAGRMRPEEVAPLIIQALEGLRAAHEVGIIHRDLKPDNIFVLKEKVGQRDFVKLIDFGISKFTAAGGSEMKMTRTGTLMGTPYYMSPEQASGSRDADHRSDLYAIGVILYEAVTGRVPFDATTFNQLLFQIVLSEPVLPQQLVPELDAGFASLIAKAMTRDMEHRFQTAAEMSQALSAWLQSGASVSIPPPTAQAPLVGRPGMGSQPLIDLSGISSSVVNGATTPGAWAKSQSTTSVGAPQSKVVLPLLVLLGLALTLGVAFGAYRVFGSREEALAAASAVPSATVMTATVGATAPVVAPAVVPVVPEVTTLAPTAAPSPSVVVAPYKPNPGAASAAVASKVVPAKGKDAATKSEAVKGAAKPTRDKVDFGY